MFLSSNDEQTRCLNEVANLWLRVSLASGILILAKAPTLLQEVHLYLFSFELPVTRYLLQLLAIVGVYPVLLEIGRLCVGDMIMDGQQPFGIYYIHTHLYPKVVCYDATLCSISFCTKSGVVI
jgi:hypothetical protein